MVSYRTNIRTRRLVPHLLPSANLPIILNPVLRSTSVARQSLAWTRPRCPSPVGRWRCPSQPRAAVRRCSACRPIAPGCRSCWGAFGVASPHRAITSRASHGIRSSSKPTALTHPVDQKCSAVYCRLSRNRLCAQHSTSAESSRTDDRGPPSSCLPSTRRRLGHTDPQNPSGLPAQPAV
jgi:hypothetical protein